MRNLTQALTLSSMATAVRSAFKIASVNPVLWWDAESHRQGLVGGAATLFQDGAGTSAVTAVEQPVGRAVDQSGNARHGLQATSTARPILTARKNLLTYSEQFDNAAWVKVQASVAANATMAPDGSITADKILDTTVNTQHLVYFASTNAGGLFTFSVYLKAAERAHARIFAFSWAPNDFTVLPSAYINLTSGTVTSSTQCVAVVTNAGNGWYRVSVSSVSAFPKPNFGFYVAPCAAPNNDTYAGDGASGIFAWGAQLETGTVATSYQRITTATDYDITAAPLMLQFDGVDDSLSSAAFTSGTLPASADLYMVVKRAPADGNSALLYSGSNFVGMVESGSSSRPDFGAGTPTYTVNGGSIAATRTALNSALTPGVVCLLEIRGADLSAWTSASLGLFTSYQLTGGIGDVLVTPAKPDATRAKIRKALAKTYRIQGGV